MAFIVWVSQFVKVSELPLSDIVIQTNPNNAKRERDKPKKRGIFFPSLSWYDMDTMNAELLPG